MDELDEILNGVVDPGRLLQQPAEDPAPRAKKKRTPKAFREGPLKEKVKKQKKQKKTTRVVIRKTKPPEEYQVEAYRRVLAGESMDDIAELMGVSRQALAKTFAKIELQLIPEWMDDIRCLRVRHSERLERIVGKALRAWERSCQNKERVTHRDTVDKNGKPYTEVTRTVEGQSGDPRHLQIAVQCMKEIRAIWGADEPIKVQHDMAVRVAGRPIEEVRRQAAEALKRIAGRVIGQQEPIRTVEAEIVQ